MTEANDWILESSCGGQYEACMFRRDVYVQVEIRNVAPWNGPVLTRQCHLYLELSCPLLEVSISPSFSQLIFWRIGPNVLQRTDNLLKGIRVSFLQFKNLFFLNEI